MSKLLPYRRQSDRQRASSTGSSPLCFVFRAKPSFVQPFPILSVRKLVALASIRIMQNRIPAGTATMPINAMPIQNTQPEAITLIREARFLPGKTIGK